MAVVCDICGARSVHEMKVTLTMTSMADWVRTVDLCQKHHSMLLHEHIDSRVDEFLTNYLRERKPRPQPEPNS